MTYSIIQKSQLEGAIRIDAEYYQSEYLDVSKKLNALETIALGNFCKIADGDHSAIPGFVETDGIRYLRAKDLQDFFIDDSDAVFIDKEYFRKIKRSHIKPLDIVLSIMGTVGNIAVVSPQYGIVTANRAVAIISPKTQDIFSSYFLAIYLESRYGVSQKNKESMGGVQQRINLDDLFKIKIPVISKKNQLEIISVVEKATKEKEDSTLFFKQAEGLFLSELGLKDFIFKDDLFFVVDSSKVKDRIDADYFQPKYEQLIEKLKLFKVNKLEDYISNYSTGFTFKSENYQEEGIPLIRINNIKKGLIDLSDTAYLSEKDFSLSPKDEAKPGDIVLSMSGSIGLTAMIPPEIPKCSVNQRILKFTSKNINKEYLVLVLNSIIGNLQLERIGTGGVQTNISYNDIKNVLIPELETDTQQKIAELVEKSHEARKKSKGLLEEAKRKIEEMIEKRN